MHAARDQPDRAGPWQLDDATVEALFGGDPVPADLAPLARVVSACRDAAQVPARPSAELAIRMATGAFTGPRRLPLRRWRQF